MGKTIRSTHATITRDTTITPYSGILPGSVGPVVVVIGNDLTISFGDGGTIPERIHAMDGLLDGLTSLRERLERIGEQRFEELADHHDAAHDADCACLLEHGRTYLVPIVGERVPEPEPEAVPA